MGEAMKQKQGEYKQGIWTPTVNNPEGHNKHTPKSQLIGKKAHKYKLMDKEEQLEELKRLFTERRYHSAMSMKYAQKVSYMMECMGIEPKKSEADKRADNDFAEKEGE